MCARFAFYQLDSLVTLFGALAYEGYGPHYNIAATDPVLSVMERDGARRTWPLQWGLVPSWSKDPSSGSRLINARAETVMEKPSFRGALKYRRCLIPADGYYEWKGPKGAKQPYFIHRRDGETMAFAGLWETWERAEGYLETCSIITTEAGPDTSEIHERVPVILESRDWELWMDRGVTEGSRVAGLLRSSRVGTLEAYPVGKAVGNVRAEGPELLARVEEDEGLGGLFG